MSAGVSPRAFAHNLSEGYVVDIAKRQPLSDSRGWQVSGCAYPADSPLIYIKYGHNGETLRDSEARTQQWAFDALKMKVPPEERRHIHIPEIYRVFEFDEWTYILMEYIPGKTLLQIMENWQAYSELADKYADQIAAGLRLLLSLPVPEDAAPGPVGGGLVRHALYQDHRAPIEYDSVDMMEKHLNKVATMITDKAPTVKLERELHLVFADLYEGNFKFTEDGDMYFVDLKQASFLPLSFMSYALIQPHRICAALQEGLDGELPQENLPGLRHTCGHFVMSSRRICTIETFFLLASYEPRLLCE